MPQGPTQHSRVVYKLLPVQYDNIVIAYNKELGYVIQLDKLDGLAVAALSCGLLLA